MTIPTQAYIHVYDKAGSMDKHPIPNAKQSVSEVIATEHPACLIVAPVNSVMSALKIY